MEVTKKVHELTSHFCANITLPQVMASKKVSTKVLKSPEQVFNLLLLAFRKSYDNMPDFVSAASIAMCQSDASLKAALQEIKADARKIWRSYCNMLPHDDPAPNLEVPASDPTVDPFENKRG